MSCACRRAERCANLGRRRRSDYGDAEGDRAAISATGCSSSCRGRRGDDRGRLRARGGPGGPGETAMRAACGDDTATER